MQAVEARLEAAAARRALAHQTYAAAFVPRSVPLECRLCADTGVRQLCAIYACYYPPLNDDEEGGVAFYGKCACGADTPACRSRDQVVVLLVYHVEETKAAQAFVDRVLC